MKKKLTLLIFTACAVFVGSVGLVFWALAATQVNVTSGLLVTYTPGLHVVCDVNATYQRTNDSSAIAFSQGNLSLKYNGTITDTTLEASSSALQLDDSNTYVVFEFTFQNKNLEENYDLTITLTDNGTVTNMTRKYYFGDLSSSNISTKRTTIKNSGIDNSSLSSKKLVLGYQETGRIYMLLEITPGTSASYLADNTNKFAFTMTTAKHVEAEKVSYLNKNWAEIIFKAPSNTSMIYEGSTQQPILGVGMENFPYQEIIFTKDNSLISELTNSISVGTVSETSTSAYTHTEGIDDVTAYYDNDKTRIVIYSPSTIYAPENCIGIFHSNKIGAAFYYFSNLSSLDLSNLDTSKVTDMSSMFERCFSLTSLDLGNFNLVSCTNFTNMLYNCSALQTITLPYNLQSGYTIDLPRTSSSDGYWMSSIGGMNHIYIDSSICSTETEKVTLDYYPGAN